MSDPNHGRFDATLSLPPGTPAQTAATIGVDAQQTHVAPSSRRFGDYELLEEIARGAMGVVYRARQISLNRIVALKMILAGRFASELDVLRFHQEAEAAGNLDHPNILPIYDVGEVEGFPFFSMKLANGGSLANSMARLRESPRHAVRALEQIARGIHHAHQRGILHRDLKPGNVLLADPIDGDLDMAVPLITDFGLAKRTQGDSSLTQSGAIVGTPSYMSPEQARGSKTITTAADIYSLGAMLYEVLAGTPPFKGESVAQTLRMVEEQEPSSPRSLNPYADADLEAIALKCLEKDPARRYETAGTFADDLAAWQRGEPVTARRAGWTRRARKWVRRNPAVTALAGMFVLALIAGSTVSATYAVRAEQRAREAAISEREAREQEAIVHQRDEVLQDTLCVATFERARAERLAGRPGWRQRSLKLLELAVPMRVRESSAETRAGNLPTLAELRGEAVMALIADDAQQVREVPLAFSSVVHIGQQGRRMVQVGFTSDGGFGATLRIVDLKANRELSKLSLKLDPELESPNFNLIQMAAINPDGSQALCRESGNESKLAVHDLSTGKKIAELSDAAIKKTAAGIDRVRYSPDGKKVVAVRRMSDAPGKSKSETSELIVWDLAKPDAPIVLARQPTKKSSGMLMGMLDVDIGEFSGARFTNDSRRICYPSTDRKSIHIRDLSTNPPGKLADIPVPGQVLTLDWHPTKPEVAIVTAGAGPRPTITLWDMTENKAKVSREWDFPLDSEFGFVSIAFSPDGKYLAGGGGQVTTVHVFGGDDLQVRFQLVDTALLGVARVFWTADGELGVNSVMESLRFFKPEGTDLSANLSTVKPFGAAAFSADGRWLAYFAPTVENSSSSMLAGLFDENADKSSLHERVALVDRKAGRVVRYLKGISDKRTELHFSPDGSRLIVASMTEAIGYDAATGAETLQRKLAKDPQSLQAWDIVFFLPDGRLAAIGNVLDLQGKNNTSLVMWDLEANKRIRVLNTGENGRFLTQRNVSPDGRRLYLTQNFVLGGQKQDRESFDQVVELPSGKLLSETKRPARDTNQMEDIAAISANGARSLSMNMFLGGENSSFQNAFWRVRSLPEGDELFRITNKTFTEHGNGFSPDGELVAVSADRGHIEIWNVDKREMVMRWQPHGGKSVEYLAFSPEGEVATSALGDPRLRLLKLNRVREQLKAMGLGW